MGKKPRLSRQKSRAQLSAQPATQTCCGAPKPNHYGDCKTLARNRGN